MPIGKRTACSGPSGPMRKPSPSSIRRRTSPVAFILAMRLTIRCKISSSDMNACAARTPCGLSAPTMQGLPRKWWSNASWKSGRTSAPIIRARNLSRRCGSGRKRAAAPSPASCGGLAAQWTGRASSSRWTSISPRRCSRPSLIFTMPPTKSEIV